MHRAAGGRCAVRRVARAAPESPTPSASYQLQRTANLGAVEVDILPSQLTDCAQSPSSPFGEDQGWFQLHPAAPNFVVLSFRRVFASPSASPGIAPRSPLAAWGSTPEPFAPHPAGGTRAAYYRSALSPTGCRRHDSGPRPCDTLRRRRSPSTKMGGSRFEVIDTEKRQLEGAPICSRAYRCAGGQKA